MNARTQRPALRAYQVKVAPADAPAWHYFGLFTDGFAAVIDGLLRTQGQRVRISAKALPTNTTERVAA